MHACMLVRSVLHAVPGLILPGSAPGHPSVDDRGHATGLQCGSVSMPCMQDDPELASDPLSKLDLAAFVAEQLHGLAQHNAPFFQECCLQLAPAQLAAVKTCF